MFLIGNDLVRIILDSLDGSLQVEVISWALDALRELLTIVKDDSSIVGNKSEFLMQRFAALGGEQKLNALEGHGNGEISAKASSILQRSLALE